MKNDILKRAAEIYCAGGRGRHPEQVKFSELDEAVAQAITEALAAAGRKAPGRIVKGPLEERVKAFAAIEPDMAYTESPVALCYVIHDAKRLISELWEQLVQPVKLPSKYGALMPITHPRKLDTEA